MLGKIESPPQAQGRERKTMRTVEMMRKRPLLLAKGDLTMPEIFNQTSISLWFKEIHHIPNTGEGISSFALQKINPS